MDPEDGGIVLLRKSVIINKSTRRNIPEDLNVHTCLRTYIRTHICTYIHTEISLINADVSIVLEIYLPNISVGNVRCKIALFSVVMTGCLRK
jgi:hypothetical protein